MNDKLVTLWNALTPLQQGVVQGLEDGLSPRDAYRRANGTSENLKAIDVMVSKMLSSANVKAYRDALAGEKVSAMVMTREEMRLRLSQLARANLHDIVTVRKEPAGYDDGGNPIYLNRVEVEDFEDVPEDTLVALAEVQQKKDGIAIKLKDGIAAMKLLADLDGYTNKAASVTITGHGATSVTINATDPAEAATQYQELMR